VNRLNRQNCVFRLLLAVVYGLAATTAGLFHDHSLDWHSADGDACHHVAAGISHSDSQEQHSPDQSPFDGPQCVVCKFLAQKPIATAVIEEIASVALVQEVVQAAPPKSFAPVSPAWHSRAPPHAA